MLVKELLAVLTETAVDFRLDSGCYNRNNHLLDINYCPEQDVIDSVLVAFINKVAADYCVDYGLHTTDLRES